MRGQDMKGKILITFVFGLICGVVISPISLWLLVLKNSPSLSIINESTAFHMLPPQDLSAVKDDAETSAILQYEAEYSKSDKSYELIQVAVLSKPKSLYNRGFAAYNSYGKNFNRSFRIYTAFPSRTLAIDDRKRKAISNSLHFMEPQLENVTDPKELLIHFMDHLCQNNVDLEQKSHFVVILHDDLYIHAQNLQNLIYSVLSLSPVPIYIGLASKNGYCEISNGILLHRTGFEKVCSNLDHCWDLVHSHSDVSEFELLGKCFSEILGMKCWTPAKGKSVFTTNERALDDDEMLHNAVTIHPIKDEHQFYSLHRRISEIQAYMLMKQARSVIENVIIMDDMTTIPEPNRNGKWVWYANTTSVNPKSKHDLLSWCYTDLSKAYQLHEHLPSFGLSTRLKSSLDKALRVFVDKINSTGEFKDNRFSITDGYYTVDEAAGMEYILMVSINKKSAYLANVLLPFNGPAFSFSYPIAGFYSSTVHIIVPVAHYHNMVPFLEMYENIILDSSITNKAVCLHLVFFDHDELITRKVSQIKAIYSTAQIEVHEIKGSKHYSNAYAYNHVAELLSGSELMVFFDNSLRFTSKFLSHCRMNTIRGKQVFSPVLFSLYREDLAIKDISIKQDNHIISDKGFFLRYNYQVVCIYRSDYARVGGYKHTKRSSGNSDTSLMENILRSDLYFMRALEPFLTKPFQSRKCKGLKSKAAQDSCVKSAADSIGSKKSLGTYILRNEL